MPAEGIFPAVGAVIGQSAKVAFSGVMPSIERMSSSGSGGSWSSGRGTVDVDALAVIGTDYIASSGSGYATWSIHNGFLPGSTSTRVRAPRVGVTYLAIVDMYISVAPGDALDAVVGFSTTLVSGPGSSNSRVGGEFNRAVMKSAPGPGGSSEAWTSSFTGVWTPSGSGELGLWLSHSNSDPARILPSANGLASTVALIGMR